MFGLESLMGQKIGKEVSSPPSSMVKSQQLVSRLVPPRTAEPREGFSSPCWFLMCADPNAARSIIPGEDCCTRTKGMILPWEVSQKGRQVPRVGFLVIISV